MGEDEEDAGVMPPYEEAVKEIMEAKLYELGEVEMTAKVLTEVSNTGRFAQARIIRCLQEKAATPVSIEEINDYRYADNESFGAF